MDTHTPRTFQCCWTIPKMSGERWVEGEVQRQGVPKRLGVEKESRQVRICLRVTGPSSEAHKGALHHVCNWEDSPVSWAEPPPPVALAPEGDHAMLPGQASFAQCCETDISVHKQESKTKGQLLKNTCARTVKKSCRGFPKQFTDAYRLIKGERLCYICFHTSS